MAVIDALDKPVAETIARFIDALWAERGLSKATLAAYQADLARFAASEQCPADGLLSVAPRDIQAYLAARTGPGNSPRSVARLLSSLSACSYGASWHARAALLMAEQLCSAPENGQRETEQSEQRRSRPSRSSS